MRYVLDCSVAIKWFVPEALSDVALGLFQRLEAGELTLVALTASPPSWDTHSARSCSPAT